MRWFPALFLMACTPDALDSDAPAGPEGLAVVHQGDPERAEAGMRWLTGETAGNWGFPLVGFQALGFVTGGGGLLSNEELWTLMVERYGFVPNPEGSTLPPLGVRLADASTLQITCLSCHADRVGGETIVGTGNGSIDMEFLASDLTVLADMAGIDTPMSLDGFNGGPGSHDAWGLGYKLTVDSYPGGENVNTDYGFQQAPAWWSRRYKEKLYTDGSGSADGVRTMAAMYLGYGASLDQIQAMEADTEDAWHTMVLLESPAWPFGGIDAELASQGEQVFETTCARCHGSYSGGVYPNQVVARAEIGTDPLRSEAMGPDEAAWIQNGWFGGDSTFEATDGYLAPVLHGVWATAPYFHNGSVPTIADVLNSTGRPAAWQKTGRDAEDYDQERVGLKFDEVDPGSVGGDAARKVTDTTKEGMSNAGHTFGDALSDDDRRAVLEYLKQL